MSCEGILSPEGSLLFERPRVSCSAAFGRHMKCGECLPKIDLDFVTESGAHSSGDN